MAVNVIGGGLSPLGAPILAVGPAQPDTSEWPVNAFWYDTSTETP